jgi:D-3-phosphoglycerate dehydrogenase
MTEKYRVKVLNHISANGLRRLPWDRFAVSAEVEEPHAILLRSADLHGTEIPPSVLAIGRAGTGTNNIPVPAMSARGVPVFNAPGANANAVKESGNKAYAGNELSGHTLGVIGLGKIGCLVADAAIKLGMHVIGYDPEITVDSAWSLPSTVKKAHSLGEVLRHSHFVTLHVPLVEATRGMLDAGGVAQMKPGAVVLNFSRSGVVDEAAVLEALEEKHLARYVCDFPSRQLNGHVGVIVLPHLGASTREAEENCAVMVAEQVRDYLIEGTIANAVNFPDVALPRESPWRLAIANANVPNMVGGISHAVASAGLNIATMTNKSRGDLAYTLVDVDSDVPSPVIDAIAAIDGVLKVRYLPT